MRFEQKRRAEVVVGKISVFYITLKKKLKRKLIPKLSVFALKKNVLFGNVLKELENLLKLSLLGVFWLEVLNFWQNHKPSKKKQTEIDFKMHIEATTAGF